MRLGRVDPGPARAGADAQAVIEAEVVGHLERPLVQASGRVATFARAIADGVLRTDDRLDRIYISPGDLWNQPARDGVDAFLDAGDVTLAQVLRATPLTGARSAWGGQLVATGLSADAGRQAIRALRREHDWRPIAATLRDGLMAAVAR